MSKKGENTPLLKGTPKKDNVDVSTWQKIRTKTPYYFPIIFWMPNYDWKTKFVKDVVAGLGVAFMLIPQSLAYANLAGLPPIIGLYSALVPLFMYTLFGTSRQMSIGPDALGSLLVGITVSHVDSNERVLVAHTVAFMTGIFLFWLGVFRFGFVDNILSRPLLCGFVNAVAIIIICDQVNPLLGISIPLEEEHGWRRVVYALKHIKEFQFTTFAIGFTCIVILVLIQMIKHYFGRRVSLLKFIPQTLVVVVLGILVTYFARLDRYGVKILGKIPNKFPVPQFPKVNLYAREFLEDAIVIGIIGFVESIVVGKIYSNKHNYRVSANRELVALGVSNFVGSFFRIYPTFGSLPRSAVADNMGAQSQLFNSVAACVILSTILFFGRYFEFLPIVVMSGIIIVAAVLLLELHDIVFLWKIKAWKSLCQLLGTFLVSLFLGPELGIFISVCISVFMLVKRTTNLHLSILGRVPSTGKFVKIAQHPEAETIDGIIIVRIEETLYFANISQLKSALSKIEKTGSHVSHPTDEANNLPPIRAVIIHAAYISSMDSSALQILSEMMEIYEQRGVRLYFVKIQEKLKPDMIRAGLISGLRSDRIFDTTEAAVNYIMSHKEFEEGNGETVELSDFNTTH
eukprot:TRINITY_DN12835_c0_g1_i1.p1 TRINITY_DN12835_c0_g1~~TRINITY_DN12835_c0_g1_i1.p1  ORF type:complete len:637 (-),score=99.12 TRINITY_DN12835_c0_g1_i1:14-1897(-)